MSFSGFKEFLFCKWFQLQLWCSKENPQGEKN